MWSRCFIKLNIVRLSCTDQASDRPVVETNLDGGHGVADGDVHFPGPAGEAEEEGQKSQHRIGFSA